MSKGLVYLSLLTALGSASAAEMCSDTNFSGFYLGVHAGETLWNTFWVDRDDWVDNFNDDFAVGTVANKYDGFSGGLQAGYNWLCSDSVYGLEVDWSWIDISDLKSYSPSPTNSTALNLKNELDWYGSIRARAGILADNLLLYITGGAAFSRFTHDWLVVSVGNANSPEQLRTKHTRWGEVVGVGGELAVCPELTVKVEGMFFTFPKDTSTLLSNVVVGASQRVHFETQNSFFVFRIGLNYSFDILGY